MTHWGTVVADALKARGVDTIFTLSGGHLFPLYDGAVAAGIRLIDVRHEATAVFAAEAWGRLGRSVGVAAVTAGPGVFNSINGIATAQKNGSALLVLGGRAPESRWGMGSLQEIDHVPVAAPLTKISRTAGSDPMQEVSSAIRQALTPPRGPVFIDLPLDLITSGDGSVADTADADRIVPDADQITALARLIDASERPMMIAGSNVYADGAWASLWELVERSEIAVFTNGMGRGTIPADHPVAFSRARGTAMGQADLAIVVGTPMDFRLSFGDRFPAGCKVVHIDSAPELLTTNRELAVAIGADIALVFEGLAAAVESKKRPEWIDALRADEQKRSSELSDELASDRVPIHPMRIYGELNRFLDRDAVIIGDGGDFVSYAGREIPSYVPGSWLDPGPFGCLGVGPGYAIAAKLMHPDRQVVLLLGDGAFGFSGMEFDTMVRHGLPVVAVVGNNGIWALEKHPMRAFFGYDVVADLRQETRYDKVVEALGGHGETVTDPDEIGPALKRAVDSGLPALVNVLTDPEEVYPRSANLA